MKNLKKLENNKKAMSLGDLPNIVLVLVVIGIVAAIGLIIQTELETDVSNTYGNDSDAALAIADTITGTSNLTARLPLIGLIIGFAVLIGIVVRFLWGGRFGM
jgi:hypothetical protein